MLIDHSKQAWIDNQKLPFLPASEVVCSTVLGATITEAGTLSGTNFEPIFNGSGTQYPDDVKPKVATLEMGLWKLDGSCDLFEGQFKPGYVSSLISAESTGFAFSTKPTCTMTGATTFLPGAARNEITIVWGKSYGEYATDFSVTVTQEDAYGNTRTDTYTVTDNDSVTSKITVTPVEYTQVGDTDLVYIAWTIKITVNKWSLPNRRCRADIVVFGDYFIWSGSEIIEYSDENSCDPLSLDLPSRKCSIKFHDPDEVWQADNQNSKLTSLSDRQEVRVVYNTTYEQGGERRFTSNSGAANVYYLSEWDSDSDGLTATFHCSSPIEWMDVEFKYAAGVTTETDFPLYDLIVGVQRLCNIDGSLITHPFTYSDTYVCKPVLDPNDETYYLEFNGATCAEVLQMIANSRGYILKCTRDGKISIEKREDQNAWEMEYSIPLSMCYEYPNLYLSKQLRSVNVNSQFGWKTVNDDGVDQTVENELITDRTWANTIATWIASILKNRITIHGEYRADPVLDAGDIVEVETKRGKNAPFITNVSRRFNGGWSGSYDARCLNTRWL